MRASELRLMCVLAHPDDESLGTGGALAKYAREGIATYVVTATRGERGRFGDAPSPGPDVVGATREAELRKAARELGVREVTVLDHADGGLAQADASVVIARIAERIAVVRPHVVVTFGPDGAYGHPDHVAISQHTTAAIVEAAGAGHQVSKLYFIAWSAPKWEAYQAALKRLVYRGGGAERQAVPWQDWAITTCLDTVDVTDTVWRAVSCHQTQMSVYRSLGALPPDRHRQLWGTQEFYRAFSRVPVGSGIERDLFEGLR
jgi:LmbE family N-acetylglucosaminyl deacetylase